MVVKRKTKQRQKQKQSSKQVTKQVGKQSINININSGNRKRVFQQPATSFGVQDAKHPKKEDPKPIIQQPYFPIMPFNLPQHSNTNPTIINVPSTAPVKNDYLKDYLNLLEEKRKNEMDVHRQRLEDVDQRLMSNEERIRMGQQQLTDEIRNLYRIRPQEPSFSEAQRERPNPEDDEYKTEEEETIPSTPFGSRTEGPVPKKKILFIKSPTTIKINKEDKETKQLFSYFDKIDKTQLKQLEQAYKTSNPSSNSLFRGSNFNRKQADKQYMQQFKQYVESQLGSS